MRIEIYEELYEQLSIELLCNVGIRRHILSFERIN